MRTGIVILVGPSTHTKPALPPRCEASMPYAAACPSPLKPVAKNSVVVLRRSSCCASLSCAATCAGWDGLGSSARRHARSVMYCGQLPKDWSITMSKVTYIARMLASETQ